MLLVVLILGPIVAFVWQNLPPSTVKTPPLPHYPLLTEQQLKDQVLNDMIFVQGGSYQMGTDDQKYMTGDNSHAHKVVFSSFYMSKYLTSGQQLESYYQLTNQTEKIPDPMLFYDHGQYPATASWNTADQYCHWLGKISGLPLSLPTEGQWEYAARNGGKNILYATDNGQLEIGKNYPYETELEKNVKDYPRVLFVTAYPVNMIGLHQMGGNVLEWMKDWYSPIYYSASPVDNPQGPAQMNREDIKQNGGGRKALRRVDIFNYGRDDGQFQDMTVYARSSDVATGPLALAGERYGYIYGFRWVINNDKLFSELKAATASHKKDTTKTLLTK